MDLMPRNFSLDDIFDNFLTDKSYSNMKCDIYEKGGDYHIEMDIPGFDKKDISIETKDGYLIISIETKDGYLIVTAEKNNENDEEDKDKKYICHERTYGKYQRSFYIGEIDTDKIEAEFTNGMLKVTVPKKEKTVNKKMIEIK